MDHLSVVLENIESGSARMEKLLLKLRNVGIFIKVTNWISFILWALVVISSIAAIVLTALGVFPIS